MARCGREPVALRARAVRACARRRSPMLRNLMLLLAVAAVTGCAARPRMVRNDSLDQLENAAATDLRCSEEELRTTPLTLLTRIVGGCGRQAVYAYDWMLARWVL